LIVSISTPDAVVLSTTESHLAWLGRDREGVVGHCCSEWASAENWELNWHLFQCSLSTGMPIGWERSVLCRDGSNRVGQITVKPLGVRGRPLMLCVSRVLEGVRQSSLRDEMARCLAQMSGIIPLSRLKESLEEIAADAASVAEGLFAPH
jgi:hypothetical protein